MSKKFETIVKEQNQLIEENMLTRAAGKAMNAAGGAVNDVARWAAQNSTARNFMNGRERGSNESKIAYALRLLSRGDKSGLQEFKKYDPAAIPVLLDYDTKYAKVLSVDLPNAVNRYTHGNVRPTLANFNSVDYLKEIGNVREQQAFINECLANIDRTHVTTGSPLEFAPSTGRFWAGAVNEGGVLIQFQKDARASGHFVEKTEETGEDGLPGSASRTPRKVAEKILELRLNEANDSGGGGDLMSNDIDTWNKFCDNFLLVLLRPVNKKNIYNLLVDLDTGVVSAATPSYGSTEGLGTKPLYQVDAVMRFINTQFRGDANNGPIVGPDSSGQSELMEKFLTKILSVISTKDELKSVISLLDPAAGGNSEQKCSCLGIPSYPVSKFSRKLLAQQYYLALPKALRGIGVPGIEDDLYFIPEDQLEEAKAFLNNQATRQFKAYLFDKTAAKIKNAIANPFQTINKMAGQYGFDSMYTNIQSS